MHLNELLPEHRARDGLGGATVALQTIGDYILRMTIHSSRQQEGSQPRGLGRCADGRKLAKAQARDVALNLMR